MVCQRPFKLAPSRLAAKSSAVAAGRVAVAGVAATVGVGATVDDSAAIQRGAIHIAPHHRGSGGYICGL